MSRVVSPAQFLLVAPASSCCCPTFFAVTPWTRLNTSGDIYSGASGSVCSFVATILQEASWQTDGRLAAAFHKLLNLLHICVSTGRMFPSSGFDILKDELHAAVLKRLFKSLWAIVLVMLHLVNSTNKYRCSWKRKHSPWQASFSCCFLCLASCHITIDNNSRFT